MTYDKIKDIDYDLNEFLGFRNNWYTFSHRVLALLIEGILIIGLLIWLEWLLKINQL